MSDEEQTRFSRRLGQTNHDRLSIMGKPGRPTSKRESDKRPVTRKPSGCGERTTIPAIPIRLGISRCLLRDEVRFDGGHKRDRFLADTLSRYVEWVPVCPEVEVGMGIPLEPIRLVGAADSPRLIAVKSGVDHTLTMERFSRRGERVNWSRWTYPAMCSRRIRPVVAWSGSASL